MPDEDAMTGTAATRRLPRAFRSPLIRALSILLPIVLLLCFVVYLNAPSGQSENGPVYLEHGVPWGILTLDGHAIDAIDLEVHSSSLALAPGTHHLVYTAELFPTLDCTVSMPVRAADSCPIVRDPDTYETQVILRAGPGRIVDLGATVERLTQADRNALYSRIEASLAFQDSTETVVIGERYRMDASSVVTTATPLTAKLMYRLNHDPSRTIQTLPSRPACVTVCHKNVSLSLLSNGTATWVIAVHVVVSWIYTDSTRGERQTLAPPAPATISPDEALALFVQWQSQGQGDGQWQISAANLPGLTPICSIALRQSQAERAQSALLKTRVGMPSSPAQGCLIFGPSSQSSTASIRLLYRFGVLLAADSATHRYLPSLPEATSQEAAIASAIESNGTALGV